jgi:hypothetical protein
VAFGTVSGRLAPYALRSRFVAIHPDVYLGRDVALTAELRAKARWLWSRRREDVRVAAEYDGDHHRSRRQFNADIRRMEALNDLGWLVVRVTAEDTPGGVIHRVAAARARRT